MRVSDVHQWAQCEQRALQAPRSEASRINVAAWVGTAAHAILNSQSVEEPSRLAFDRITPDFRIAARQARMIAERAWHELTTQEWILVNQERAVRGDSVEGHLDILAYHREHGHAVIDLKTGQTASGWLQVGGYIDLLPVDERERIRWGGILSATRVPLVKEIPVKLELRPATRLIIAWRDVKRRVDAILDGERATTTPGLHCGSCPLDCAVRAS